MGEGGNCKYVTIVVLFPCLLGKIVFVNFVLDALCSKIKLRHEYSNSDLEHRRDELERKQVIIIRYHRCGDSFVDTVSPMCNLRSVKAILVNGQQQINNLQIRMKDNTTKKMPIFEQYIQLSQLISCCFSYIGHIMIGCSTTFFSIHECSAPPIPIIYR